MRITEIIFDLFGVEQKIKADAKQKASTDNPGKKVELKTLRNYLYPTIDLIEESDEL